MKVHNTLLGPGLQEATYQHCLAHDWGFRLDILVESEIIVEAKPTQAIAPIHKAHLLTYLKLAKKKVGLLINFKVEHLRDGITRLIL